MTRHDDSNNGRPPSNRSRLDGSDEPPKNPESGDLPTDDPADEAADAMAEDSSLPEDEWDSEPVPLTQLRIRRDGSSGTIILDRPQQHNALSTTMVAELIQTFEDFYRVGGVRAVILTGAGASFCAGTDLRELAGRVGEDDYVQHWSRESQQIQKLVETMLRFPKPIIAAVDGPVRGLGLALVLASDIVVGSRRASFALPEPRLGLVAAQTAPLLSFRIGHGQAARLLLTSQVIDGEEAHRIGLVHELVLSDQIWVHAQGLAEQCALGARESIQLTKQLLNETIGEALETQHAIAAAYAATARTTFAASEGVRAFVEKRPPDWNRI